MSAESQSNRVAKLAWVGRKLIGFLIVYVALGSFYQSIRAGNNIAIVLYVLLGILGLYLLANW